MNRTSESSVAKYRLNREHRYTLRAAAARFGGWSVEHTYGGDWDLLPWRATAGCSRSILADDGTVVVRCGTSEDGSRRAYFAGVRRCGSVWLCPVCTATIRSHRADEVGTLADAHQAAGGRQSMLTLTVRHHHDTPLEKLYDSIRKAYTSLQQSARWRDYREQMVGQTVTVESTLGDNGFHVHLHVLLLWKAGTSDGAHRRRLSSLRTWGGPAWAERVERRLGERPSDRRGFHVMDMAASSARYVAKIAGEITRGDYKSSDALDVMLRGVLAHDARMSARYVEWATVMPGKRMIRFSPGLRELYLGTTPELTDEEVVNLDPGSPDVGELSRADYLSLTVATKSKPIPGAPRFLEIIEDTGWHPMLTGSSIEEPWPASRLAVSVELSRGLGFCDQNDEVAGKLQRPWERSPKVAALLASVAAVDRPEVLPVGP